MLLLLLLLLLHVALPFACCRRSCRQAAGNELVQLPQPGVCGCCGAGDVQPVQGNCKEQLCILRAVLTPPVRLHA
jgi:hypothetical protein